MQKLTAGITKAGAGIDGIVWNILGHRTEVGERELVLLARDPFPPGTFVPPHIHPARRLIYLFEGRLDLLLDGKDVIATAGNMIRLPMGQAHGIFSGTRTAGEMFFLGVADAQALRLVFGLSIR